MKKYFKNTRDVGLSRDDEGFIDLVEFNYALLYEEETDFETLQISINTINLLKAYFWIQGEDVRGSFKDFIDFLITFDLHSLSEIIEKITAENFEEKLTETLTCYQEQSLIGNPQAQNYLGEAYEHGCGVEKNEYQAFRLYEKAAAQGYALAENNLGLCYLNGIGVEQDQKKPSSGFIRLLNKEMIQLN